MMTSLLLRTLYEKRWFMAGWSIAFGVLSALIVMFFPSFSQGGGFDEVAKSLPSQLQGFIGDPSVFQTLDGFIASQIYDIRMSLMIIIMTLILAVSLTVREEESGDMRTTLMTSLSRPRVTFEKFVAGCIIITVLNIVSVAGIYVGTISIAEQAPNALIWQLCGLACIFGYAAFSIPFSIALCTGKRGITMTIGLIVAIGSYILSTFSRTVAWLKNWDHVSLMHYFNTASVREHTFNWFDVWVLMAIIGIMLSIAVIFFRKRDIT